MIISLANRLRRMKMSYREYLDSDHWRDVRARYRASFMPQECIGCGESRVELHHITYARLGRELLGDLMPLCRTCHQSVHDYAESHTTNLTSIACILRTIKGWSRPYTREKMRPFNVNGIRNPYSNLEVLTPKQLMREMRKIDPENPAYWTPKQKLRRGITDSIPLATMRTAYEYVAFILRDEIEGSRFGADEMNRALGIIADELSERADENKGAEL